jgi:integrase
MRISELLALSWADVDFGGGVIHVRAQLSRAHHGNAARRVQPKTAAAIRDIPLVAQLSALLREHREGAAFTEPVDFVFATGNGTPLGHPQRREPRAPARRRRGRPRSGALP